MPNKGHLHELTIELLEHARLHLDNGVERKLYAGAVNSDVTVLFAHVADTPEYVRDGAAEISIMRLNRIRKPGHELEDLLDLEYRKCRLVLVAPEDGNIETVVGVSGKIVTTEFPHITQTYFEKEDIDAEVIKVMGAIELTPHIEMADAIIDITSTGTTLQMNRLVVADEVLPPPVWLFVRPDVVDDLKVQQLFTALEPVRSVEGKCYLMMNAPYEKLDKVKEVVPGLDGPTAMDVTGDSTVVVHVVVNERDVLKVVSDLKNVDTSDTPVTEVERLAE